MGKALSGIAPAGREVGKQCCILYLLLDQLNALNLKRIPVPTVPNCVEVVFYADYTAVQL